LTRAIPSASTGAVGDLRREIDELVRLGAPPDTIEAELLTPRAWLDDDERAALWLYAWLAAEMGGGRSGGRHVEPVRD